MTTKYLEHLFDIGIEIKRNKIAVKLFFISCIKGDSSPIIRDLDKLITNPFEKYGPNDWRLIKWVNKKVKGEW